MRILVADDERMCRHLLERCLKGWGHEVTLAEDGAKAWECLRGAPAPHVAVLDWMMPVLSGPDLCRKLRALAEPCPVYVILLTSNNRKEEIIAGLGAGADDYIVKPFDHDEFYARLQTGLRIVRLQQNLAARVAELEAALSQVKQLQGLLPICSYCKRIRDDKNYWQQVEHYIGAHTQARFSHGICPDCYTNVVSPQLAAACPGSECA
jgi:DNA-binding response OmpR family regulator